MKNKYTIGLFLLWATVYVLTSCRKFVEISGPKNQLTTGQVFADSLNANAAVLGIYYQIAAGGSFGLLAGGMTLYPGLSSDEMNITTTDASMGAIFNNNILVTNDKIQTLYTQGYRYIYQTNACIEGIAASSQLSATAKARLTAEARFLRAFVYFNLVNLYGGLPIVTTSDYNVSRLIARSSPDLVYQQIVADLLFAQSNLLMNTMVKDRADYYTATALLARVYLYTGKYALAVSETDKVIGSGKFTLESNLNNVFLFASRETIWHTSTAIPLQATYEGLYFVPSSATAKPRYVISGSLYDAFEPRDNRKLSWIKVNINSGQAYPYPFKYKIRTQVTSPTENYVVSRLAEQYLIRAEARTNLDDLDGGRKDVNMIRSRAGLGNVVAADKASLLLAIEKERRVELFCEWGNRWLDLKRTKRALAVLGQVKPNLNENSLLYPIPVKELNTNPNISQNPGY
ncbi:RagB/SusD family nutrient uptake outer membrane protein [Mucilaginibacter sp. HD30]